MALAKEIGAYICIIDDLLARRYAKYYHPKITDTIGILLKSKKLGIVNEIKPIYTKDDR